MNLNEDYENMGRINKSVYASNIEAFMAEEIEERQSVLGLSKLISAMKEEEANIRKN